jgi:hypothetical protein
MMAGMANVSASVSTTSRLSGRLEQRLGRIGPPVAVTTH